MATTEFSEDDPVPFDKDEVSELIEMLGFNASKFQWNLIPSAIQRLITIAPGLRRVALRYKNTVTSVKEGLATKEIKKADALKELKDAHDLLAFAFGRMMGDIRVSSEETMSERLAKDLDVGGLLKAYDKDLNSLQSKIQKDGTFVGYVPVLPITTPPLSVEKLKAKGVQSKSFAGYSILDKQLVLGISHDYVHTYMPVVKDASKEKISKVFSQTKEKLLPEMLELVTNKYRNLNLVAIGDPIVWAEATWVWLVPAKELELYKQCTISQGKVLSFIVKKWAFPFENRG